MYLKTLNAFYSVWLNTLKFEFCYQGFTHCTDPSIFKSLISKKWGTKCCLHNWVEHSFFPKDDSKIINFEEGVLIPTLILIIILKRQFFGSNMSSSNVCLQTFEKAIGNDKWKLYFWPKVAMKQHNSKTLNFYCIMSYTLQTPRTEGVYKRTPPRIVQRV